MFTHCHPKNYKKYYFTQRSATKLKSIRVLCWIEYTLMALILISLMSSEEWIKVPGDVNPEKRSTFIKTYKWSFVTTALIYGAFDFLVRYVLIESLYQKYLKGNQ